MDPWPDAVEGLTRLKRRFAVAPLYNDHIAGMLNLARFGGLPWDVIAGAEITRIFKPDPETCQGSAAMVGLSPRQVALGAAHNDNRRGARGAVLRTVFVRRPHEHGPDQAIDLEPATAGMSSLNR